MKFHLRFVAFMSAFIICQLIHAQCVPLPVLTVQNPSFEGPPPLSTGITPAPWSACGTPDMQPYFYGITLPATDGNSYIGLVHHVSVNWQEGVSEPLSGPMTAGVPYT